MSFQDTNIYRPLLLTYVPWDGRNEHWLNKDGQKVYLRWSSSPYDVIDGYITCQGIDIKTMTCYQLICPTNKKDFEICYIEN